MECKYCNSKWDSAVRTEKCPFCGKLILDDMCTVQSVIRKLISDQGYDVLNNGRIIIAYVSDYVQNADRDKKLLKVAYSNGIFEMVRTICQSAKLEERNSIKLQAINKLEDDAFFSRENAEYLIDLILGGCDIEISQEETSSSEIEIKIDNCVEQCVTLEQLIGLANTGNLTAEYLLGLCYKKGVFYEKDVQQAIHWLSLAANEGSVIAQYELACIWAYNRQASDDELKSAASLFKKAAESGHIWAQNDFSALLCKGRGVDKNMKESIKWLSLSALPQSGTKFNNISEQYSNASLMSAHLDELHKVVSEIEIKYARDIKNGDVHSQYGMAYILQKGEFVPKDLPKAFQYFMNGAEYGDYRAMFEVGFCYERGLGVQKNEERAEYWYKTAESKTSIMDRYFFKSHLKKDIV